jgi:hypothetical protein
MWSSHMLLNYMHPFPLFGCNFTLFLKLYHIYQLHIPLKAKFFHAFFLLDRLCCNEK